MVLNYYLHMNSKTYLLTIGKFVDLKCNHSTLYLYQHFQKLNNSDF